MFTYRQTDECVNPLALLATYPYGERYYYSFPEADFWDLTTEFTYRPSEWFVTYIQFAGLSAIERFLSRFRRTAEPQHKPFKSLGLWGSPNRFEDEYRNEKQGLGCDVYLQDDPLLAADTPDVLEVSRAD
jgi:hypothetical protein